MEPQIKMPVADAGAVEKKHTILVAEDIDSNFALVDILLRKEFNIVRATNGNDAVRLFEELQPSLILMDIQMPEMNGLDATRIIRKLDEQIPIVALTAFAFNSDRIEFLQAGGSDYVVKPIDPMQLKAMVKKILD
jgi:two-component system, cell cycle response regulator DivK